MAAHVTAASVHDFKLFSYFFALFFDILAKKYENNLKSCTEAAVT
jgi:hypothetical protein